MCRVPQHMVHGRRQYEAHDDEGGCKHHSDHPKPHMLSPSTCRHLPCLRQKQQKERSHQYRMDVKDHWERRALACSNSVDLHQRVRDESSEHNGNEPCRHEHEYPAVDGVGSRRPGQYVQLGFYEARMIRKSRHGSTPQ